ncbi:MAG: ADP-ribosylglycohydrolase family protein [Deinococcus sp.]
MTSGGASSPPGVLPTPADHFERVYAGVLGKVIGVCLGRPVEGWSYERISATFGELDSYQHAHRGWPLIIPDDDLTGTFTFVRALAEHGHSPALTSEQIGETWLNQIVEGRTCLWWGGFGLSTEQTAYARLKAGVAAPRRGSAELNGPVVSQEIGAQIFIDGWAMVAPGNPALAAALAERAARVSHDGEAVHAAVALAVMEAAAFVESDLGRLLDLAQAAIPGGSRVARLYRELRARHAEEPDWRRAREWLAEHHGPAHFGGNVPVVPNHGVILLALLYGGGELARSLMIANTCGWDTDCNAGNVGCLLGLRGGLAVLETVPELRLPLADRLYLPGAEGGRAVTDALSVALELTNAGRALAGEPPLAPGGGARYHFSLPGAVQGFQGDGVELANVADPGLMGARRLAITLSSNPGGTAWATTPTFLPPDVPEPPDVPYARGPGGGWNYTLLASPSLSPGQTVRAEVRADGGNPAPLTVSLGLHFYDADDRLQPLCGPPVELAPGEGATLRWRVPDLGGLPVADVGLTLPAGGAGTLHLGTLDWAGTPDLTLGRPAGGGGGKMWRRAWVNAVERLDTGGAEPYRLLHAQGTGMLIQGGPGWTDYGVEAELSAPLARRFGLAARVQGLRRNYSLVLVAGRVQLCRTLPEVEVLAETPLDWAFGQRLRLRLEVAGTRLSGFVDGRRMLTAEGTGEPLSSGGVALLVEEGWLSSGPVRVQPLGAGGAP